MPSERLALSDLKGYSELIGSLEQLGYRCASFDNFMPGDCSVILRHDIDIGLESALAMAELEHERGWKSIYFVLLATEFYNIFSIDGRAILSAIGQLGHEIGLHFDSAVRGRSEKLDDVVRYECEILETLLGKEIRFVAPHRPKICCPSVLGLDEEIAGRKHPYQRRFFSEAAYVSDSAGFWSHGHPLDHEKVKQRRGIQLLTHPYLWTSEALGARDQRIQELLEQRFEKLHTEAHRNFRGFSGKGFRV